MNVKTIDSKRYIELLTEGVTTLNPSEHQVTQTQKRRASEGHTVTYSQTYLCRSREDISNHVKESNVCKMALIDTVYINESLELYYIYIVVRFKIKRAR